MKAHARHRSDDLLVPVAIAYRDARRADPRTDRRLGHDPALPHGVDHRVPCHHGTIGLRQKMQKREDLRLHVHRFAGPRQTVPEIVQGAVMKRKNHVTAARPKSISGQRSRNSGKSKGNLKITFKRAASKPGKLDASDQGAVPMTKSSSIRTRRDGSIDADFYMARGRRMRSEQAHRITSQALEPRHRPTLMAGLVALIVWPFAG